jgi:hypothetical protein
LLLILLIAMTVGLALLFGRPDGQSARYTRSSDTEGALVQAREALLAYAVTYRDTHPNQAFGYLPCPDTDGDGQSDTAAGAPGCDGVANPLTATAAVGLLPYKSLGLPLLRDREGNCLWYAVSRTFKADLNKMEPMNWDTQGQIRIRDPSGNALASPDDADGGVAAVVFAPGPPLSAQTTRSGDFTNPAKPCGIPTVSTALVAQYLDGSPTPLAPPGPATPYAFGTTGTMDLSIGPVLTATSALVNNDRAAWLTPRQLFARIRARGDFPGLLNSGIIAVRNKLNSGAALAANAPSAGDGLPGGNNLASPADYDTTTEVSDWMFFRNWRDNFRYRRCAAGTYCLTVNGSQCEGVLLFGGTATTAANGTELPRPSTMRGTTAYFEGVNRASLDNPDVVFNGAAVFDANNPTQDLVYCLNPFSGTSLSFQSDFGNLGTVALDLGDVDNDGTLDRTASTDAGSLTLILGDQDLDDSVTPAANLFGCAWFGTPLPLGSTTRAYFSYRAVKDGNGFTLALADADTATNPSTSMCGRSGGSLGYSGVAGPAGIAPIRHPKLGLEIDLDQNTFGGRNDPPNDHLAIVYFGQPNDPILAGDDDDNSHVVPNPVLGGGGIVQDTSGFLNDNANRHVRLEIDSTVAGGVRTFVLSAWVIRTPGPPPPEFRNTSATTPFFGTPADAAIAPADKLFVQSAITLSPATVMQNVWVGFTNSTRDDEQEIRIQDFTITSRP